MTTAGGACVLPMDVRTGLRHLRKEAIVEGETSKESRVSSTNSPASSSSVRLGPKLHVSIIRIEPWSKIPEVKAALEIHVKVGGPKHVHGIH